MPTSTSDKYFIYILQNLKEPLFHTFPKSKEADLISGKKMVPQEGGLAENDCFQFSCCGS